jgi:hypothetical protein
VKPDKANLVRIADIAARTGVAPATVGSWQTRFGDWPEPLLAPDRRRSGAVYWWPDVEQFLAARGLPDVRMIRVKNTGRLPREPFHPWAADDY